MKRAGMRAASAWLRQSGQGMTEYYVIIAAVGVAAWLVFQGFGGVLRGQTAASASELAGLNGQPVKVDLKKLSLGDAAPANGVPAGGGNAASNGASNGVGGGSGGYGPGSNGSGNNSAGDGTSGNGGSAGAGIATGSNMGGAAANTAGSGNSAGASNSATNSAGQPISNNAFANGSSANSNATASSNSASSSLGSNNSSVPNTFIAASNMSNNWQDLINGKDAGMPQCTLQEGNPINAATGLKYQREVDYAAPEGLSFVRHYNSRFTRTTWQHNWQLAIQLNAANNLVSLNRADGKRYVFRRQGQRWLADADINGQLFAQANGWLYLAEDGSREYYNAQGRLQLLEQNNGARYSLEYERNLLVRIRDNHQRMLTLEYDDLGQLVKLLDPAGGQYLYRYDTAHNLQQVQYPDGNSRRYFYEDSRFIHALTGIVDEQGKRFATWRYDAQGRAISSEHAAGVEKVSLSFNDARSTTVTDALGNRHTVYFQEILGVKRGTGLSQPGGSGCGASTSQIVYDAQGNIISRADFNGNKTCYAYDSARNLELYRLEGVAANRACPANLAEYEPAANSVERKISTQWHPQHRMPQAQSSPLKLLRYRYDHTGHLLEIDQYTTRDSNGVQGLRVATTAVAQQTYRYDEQGRLISADGPRQDVADISQYEYDARGYVSRIRNALGQVTQLSDYDAHGRPGRVQFADLVPLLLRYDSRGQLISSSRGSEQTRFQYHPSGKLARVTWPSGAFYSYQYDDAQRLVSIRSQDGTLYYTLDAMSHRKQQTITANTARGEQTVWQHHYQFDALHRLAQDIDTLNQARTLEYDANGNLRKLAEADSSTVQRFDALNRLASRSEAQQAASLFAYDGQDRVRQFTDPRQLTTQYHYDADRNQKHSPDSGLTQRQFDPAGNMTRLQDANGQVAVYRYDALNRIIYADHGGQITRYVYDQGRYGSGQLSTIQDDSGTLSYRYNAQGRIISSTWQTEEGSYTTTYGYNVAGRLNSMTYPSGRQLEYGFDQQGRIQSIQLLNGKQRQVIVDSVQYLPFGQVQSFRYGNSARYLRQFDLDGRIKSYTLNGQPYQLSYDARSRIRQLSGPDASVRYDYDAQNRLTAWQQNYPVHYRYDANGNRTEQQFGNVRFQYRYANDSNRLLSVQYADQAAQKLQYDATGKLLQDGQRQLRYDPQGRLIEASSAQGRSLYQVNALGQRVRKQYRNLDTRFHYADNGQLLAESNKGKFSTNYIYLGELLVGVLQGEQLYYVFNDHLATPRLVTDQRRQVVWSWSALDPFGDQIPQVQKISFNLRFPGQYADAETGLFYNYQRYYQPGLGRYSQSDPIGLAGGINSYAYVENNPLSYSDPLGLWSTAAHNLIIDEFGKFWRFTPAQIQAMKDGSREADSMKYQGSAHSYIHAMSSSALDQEKACKMYNQFVGNTLQLIKVKSSMGKEREAYFEMGFRLHAVMDSVSPAHADFQEWNYFKALEHGPFPTSLEDSDDLTPELMHAALERMNYLVNAKIDCSCYAKK